MNFDKTSMLVRAKESFKSRQRRALEQFGECLERPQEKYPDYFKHVRKLNYGLLDSSLQQLSEQVKIYVY